jgi:hypothetical protein
MQNTEDSRWWHRSDLSPCDRFSDCSCDCVNSNHMRVVHVYRTRIGLFMSSVNWLLTKMSPNATESTLPTVKSALSISVLWLNFESSWSSDPSGRRGTGSPRILVLIQWFLCGKRSYTLRANRTSNRWFYLFIGDYQPVAVPLAPYEPDSSESHIYAFFSPQVSAIAFSHTQRVRSKFITFVLNFSRSMRHIMYAQDQQMRDVIIKLIETGSMEHQIHARLKSCVEFERPESFPYVIPTLDIFPSSHNFSFTVNCLPLTHQCFPLIFSLQLGWLSVPARLP